MRVAFLLKVTHEIDFSIIGKKSTLSSLGKYLNIIANSVRILWKMRGKKRIWIVRKSNGNVSVAIASMFRRWISTFFEKKKCSAVLNDFRIQRYTIIDCEMCLQCILYTNIHHIQIHRAIKEMPHSLIDLICVYIYNMYHTFLFHSLHLSIVLTSTSSSSPPPYQQQQYPNPKPNTSTTLSHAILAISMAFIKHWWWRFCIYHIIDERNAKKKILVSERMNFIINSQRNEQSTGALLRNIQGQIQKHREKSLTKKNTKSHKHDKSDCQKKVVMSAYEKQIPNSSNRNNEFNGHMTNKKKDNHIEAYWRKSMTNHKIRMWFYFTRTC